MDRTPPNQEEFTFRCADTGMNCEWQVSAENAYSIIAKVEQHAREKHNLILDNTKIRRSIKRSGQTEV